VAAPPPYVIAYAGEPGAFAEDAVLAAFGDVARTPLGSFRDVFAAVTAGDAAAGVVPIENVIHGTVRENYDLLLEFPLVIAGEVTVPVDLCLAALPGQSLDDIERVYSHIQALGQAEGFLRSRPWQLLSTYNTAGAGKAIVERGAPMLVASSFSKNFALYDERVGGLSIVGADATETASLLSHAKGVVRANYSNPPAHGGEIVATILGDGELRARWIEEVSVMRERINGNRRAFVSGLRAAGAPGGHEGLLRQRGMFSLLPLGEERVARLRDEFAIYVVGKGRINVAGLTEANLGPVCRAVAVVTS